MPKTLNSSDKKAQGQEENSIVFVNRFFWPDHSATSQLLTDLAFHLSRQGRNVGVVTSRLFYDEPHTRLPAFEEVEGVPVHRVATTAFGRQNIIGRAIDYFSFYLTASLRTFRLAKPGMIFVVKTDPPLISIPISLIARMRGAKVVNWLQDLYPELAPMLGVKALDGLIGRWLKWLRNWSLKTAHLNVAIGEVMADRLFANGIPRSHVAVVHNWTDDRAIQPLLSASNLLRNDWGITNDQFVVGYSGNLGRAHDIMTILMAARELHLSGDSKITFLFIGGGFHSTVVADYVVRHGLTNIVLKPYQARDVLPLSLTVADLHWMTLKPELEGLIVPSKLYSAAASGRPLVFIGEKTGQIGQMIGVHESGITVAPGKYLEVLEIIRDLEFDRESSMAIGNRARKMIDDHYSMDQALEKWMTLLS